MPMAVPTLAHPVALEALATRRYAGSGVGCLNVGTPWRARCATVCSAADKPNIRENVTQ